MEHPSRRFSGAHIVLGMFVFASLVTAGLWTYWELHTRPYRPLTDALGERFPDSNPRVEGGQHGMQKQTPRVLRIILRVTYNPLTDSEQAETQAAEVLRIASAHVDLNTFNRCDIHLFQQLPEAAPLIRQFSFDLPLPPAVTEESAQSSHSGAAVDCPESQQSSLRAE